MKKVNTGGKYTCNDYREEMILVGLQKRLASLDFTPEEKKTLLQEIAEAEKQMGID